MYYIFTRRLDPLHDDYIFVNVMLEVKIFEFSVGGAPVAVNDFLRMKFVSKTSTFYIHSFLI
jgi:hypothetical protein